MTVTRTDLNIFVSMILYAILLFLACFQISEKFYYYEIFIGKNWHVTSFFVIIFAFVFNALIFITRSHITKILFILTQILFIIPNVVTFLQNPIISQTQIMSYLMFGFTSISLFIIMERVRFSKKIYLSKSILLLNIFLILLLYFFFKDRMNFGNIFMNVYDVRLEANYSGTRMEAYFFAFITKFVIPLLAIFAVRSRKYFLLMGLIMCTLFAYSLGNVKSVLFGLILAVAFAGCSEYRHAVNRLLIFCILLVFMAIVEDIITDTYILHDYFVRRVFLYPPVLASYYYDFFYLVKLELSHVLGSSKIIPSDYSVSRFIGEYHMPYFTDPSSGVVVQGYVNYGLFGVFMWSVLWSLLLALFIVCGIPPYFTGLVFYIFYLGNTAFLSTLLLTHGLLAGVVLMSILKLERR